MYNDVIELNYCGNIIDKETLNCVDSKTKLKIYIVDEDGQFLSQETDVIDCKFNVKLYPGFNYLIQTITGGYLNGKVRVSTLNLQKSDSICEDIIVEKIPTGRVVLKNIYYDFDSPDLTGIAMNSIDTTLLIILQDNPDIVVLIASHTDSKGDDAYNVRLSQKRAESVVQYLIKKGIKIERLQAKGYGETIPIAENTNADGSDNPVGRQRNRRTEFKILGKLDQELFYDDGFDDLDKEE
jgi:outer membrane protein OmpA-like peptidoglycan-associated protein